MAVLEYAAILAAVLVAVFAMQSSLRRAICSRWKQAADSTFGDGRQYAPGVTSIH